MKPQWQPSAESCTVRAYAKINLTLDVLGRRSDGYHMLATVMQTINLHDTLCLTTTEDTQVRLACTVPELNTPDNLVVRAVELIRRRAGVSRGILIELYKRIPTAAGLGGGSSDAAAVLLALPRLWNLAFSFDELLEMAASLGSDVPFFLYGGLALCEGRGEQVTPLPPFWPEQMRWLLLLKPPINIATATVFRSLSPRDYTNGAHSRAVCEALRMQRMPAPADLHNSLERGVLEYYPEVARARELLLAAGATLVRLSGSGPTLFAPFADLTMAWRLHRRMAEYGYEVYLAQAIYPSSS
jgi:4-diphosphocytidyl-2-C-methyl-D-erythritol kinase